MRIVEKRLEKVGKRLEKLELAVSPNNSSQKFFFPPPTPCPLAHLEGQVVVLLVHLVVPALLCEGLRIGDALRVQHRVEVDVDEVVEVLSVVSGCCGCEVVVVIVVRLL